MQTAPLPHPCTRRAAAVATLTAALVLPCTAAADAAMPAPTKPEPKVERLVHHDGWSRIEELRIGGQTRTIDVHTRSSIPGYEVRPIDPGVSDDRSGAGARRWRVLHF